MVGKGKGEGEGTYFGLSSAFSLFPHGTDNQKGIEGKFFFKEQNIIFLAKHLFVFPFSRMLPGSRPTKRKGERIALLSACKRRKGFPISYFHC